jgi:hypothetical protein
MPILVTGSDDARDFTPAPEGPHQAVCCDVLDLGEVDDTFNPGKKKQVVRLVWQLNDLAEDGGRFTVSKRYRRSLNTKSTLYADLTSWRGRPFTPAEMAGFDLETVIGVNCLLNVAHKKSTDGTKTFANVVSVMPIMRNLPLMKPLDYTRKVAAVTLPTSAAIGGVAVSAAARPAYVEVTTDSIPF